MKSITEILSSYEGYHTKDITKITHFIGVPIIYFSIFIVLDWVHIQGVPLTWIAIIPLLIYYLMLDITLGLIATAVFVILAFIAQLIAGEQFNTTALIIAILLFVFGWVAQLVGHHYEGNRPAFLDNVLQVFVAPIYLVAEAAFYFGFRKDLQEKVLRGAKGGSQAP